MKKAVISVFLTLLLGLGMWYIKSQTSSSGIVEIETVKPEISDLFDYITMRGKVTEKARYDVFSGISGTAVEIYVTVGETVINGQELLKIIPIEGEMENSNLYNEVITAVSGLLAGFIEGGYDAVTAEAVSLVSASEDGSCVILSPCSGTVMSLNCSKNQFVSSRYPCMVISDLTNLAIKAEVEEEYLSCIDVDMKASAVIEALSSRSVSCIVDEIKPFGISTISLTGTGEIMTNVLLSVNDPNAAFLRPGYTARISVVVGKKENAILIPYETISQDDDNNQFVYAITNGKLEKVIITTGKELDEKTEVICGLDGDEMLVMYPESIKAGSTVKVK